MIINNILFHSELTHVETINKYIGNYELLKLPKTAFLCSRKIPASVVLVCYDWAIAQREAGNCVISGFHSQIEKDVLHYLLKGKQPIIIAVARGLKEKIEPELIKPLVSHRSSHTHCQAPQGQAQTKAYTFLPTIFYFFKICCTRY